MAFFAQILSILLLSLSVAQASSAESQFLLDPPSIFGNLEGLSYDAKGAKVGTARMEIHSLAGGGVQLRCTSKLESGAGMIASAEFAPEADGKLRMLRQQSESWTPDGTALGTLRIDHQRHVASCTDASGERTTEIALDAKDRVMNVPMNLYFLPLVRGEAERLNFQVLVCRPEAKLYDFSAWLEASNDGALKVRYAPDFGMLSFAARAFVPELTFWFDRSEPHTWAAHRLPLYGGGPEVTVVRDDLPHVSLAD